MNPNAERRPDRRQRAGLLSLASLFTLLTALLPGCGGGSGGVDSGGTGIMPTTLAVGPISGFGSIVVGGVHYDETQAQLVDADGQMLPASALTLGAVASIDAGPITSTATRQDAQALVIRLGEALVGPIDSIDTATSSLRVLGQQVVVSAGTVFEPSLGASVAALHAGQVVAVYGLLDSTSARTVATRIEPRSAPARYVVRGTVSSLDRTAQRLSIGTLAINLSSLGSVPNGIASGSLVRVKLSTTAAAGVWTATDLRADALTLPDRDNVELEGRITAFTNAQHFSIDGVTVDAAGITASGTLALGARVEVEGRSSNGMILARRVSVDAAEGGGAEAIELEGRITAVDASAQTFVVRGVTVAWSGTTTFVSSTAADIVVGRMVAAKGRLAADRSHVDATVVHVEL
jgi:hypothetical protein